jgi:hypothetical protein
LLEERKVEKKGINEIALTAAQFGADQSVIDAITKSTSVEDAILNAGSSLQDPAAQLKLQSLKLDIIKSQLEIASEQAKLAGLSTPLTGDIITDVATVIASGKVGQTTKTNLSAIIGVQSALEELAQSAEITVGENGDRTVSFEGITPARGFLDAEIPFTDIGLPFRKSNLSQGDIKAEAFINGINLKVQQWASGASLTAEQTKQVKAMTPKTTDTDKVAAFKINELTNFMNQQIRSALISEGIDFAIPDEVDVFADNTSLQGIFNQ